MAEPEVSQVEGVREVAMARRLCPPEAIPGSASKPIDRLKPGLRRAVEDVRAGRRPDWRGRNRRPSTEEDVRRFVWDTFCQLLVLIHRKILAGEEISSASIRFLRLALTLEAPPLQKESRDGDLPGTMEQILAEARRLRDAERGENEAGEV